MLSKRSQSIIEKATVTISKAGGRGVFVGGNFIITVAHCMDYWLKGEMRIGSYYFEEISTKKGKILKVAPLVVEPISDIGILGPLDYNVFHKELDEYEMFCESTKPVPLCTHEFELLKEFPVSIYTHKGNWVEGSAIQFEEYALNFTIRTDEQIENGTSGSPIVNNQGELVGILPNATNMSSQSDKCVINALRPHLALPAWVLHKIIDQKTE